MKYICMKVIETGEEEIFTFPNSVDHDVMASELSAMKDKSTGSWQRVRREPVSAGFVSNGECHGHSETLNLSSREQDTDILKIS